MICPWPGISYSSFFEVQTSTSGEIRQKWRSKRSYTKLHDYHEAPWGNETSPVNGFATLGKAIEDWFNSLSRWAITSFRNLAYAFYNQFAARKKRKKNLACLLSITQKKGKKLRDFIQCFKAEKLEIRDCSSDVAVAAFTIGLKYNDLVRFPYLNHPENFVDIMDRANTC